MSKLIEKAKSVRDSRTAQIAAGTAITGGTVVGTALAAGATGTNYDPTTDLTTFAQSLGNTVGPIVIVVATAMVGVAVLFWGVRYAFGFIRGRH